MNRKSLLCLFVSFFIFGLVSVSVADDPPVACFTADVLTGDIPLLVSFTDASAGEILSWEWDFGDESPFSYLQNPTHTYTSPGTFVVTLTVTGPGDSSYATCEIVTYAPLVACFTTESTPGTFPLEVDFIDESIGNIETWEWDFGDGSAHSYEQNPTHTYTTAGTYIVELEIKDYFDVYATATATCEVKVWSIQLKSVGFKSVEIIPDKWHKIYRDKGSQTAYTSDPFTNPQWEDNSSPLNGNATDTPLDHKYPICYTSGSTMKVKVILHGKGNVPTPLYLQGINGGGFNFGGLDGVEVTNYTTSGTPPTGLGSAVLNCDQSFDSNKVKYWENLDIAWWVKPGSSNCQHAGDSENQCFVTYATPFPTLTKLYHTVVYFACDSASGETTMSNIVSSIWDAFKAPATGTPSEIFRAEDYYQSGSLTVVPLKYYGAGAGTPANFYTYQLLRDADGRCGAWANLYRDILLAHGDNNSEVKTIITKDNGVWNGYALEIYSSIPGQNNSSPYYNFTNHAVVEYDGKLYDPSYGKKFDTLL